MHEERSNKTFGFRLASPLSYEPGLHRVENFSGSSGILWKMDIVKMTHFTLVTSKTENFKSKRVIFIMKILPWNWLDQQKLFVETRVKNCHFVIIKKKRIRSYLLPAWLQMQFSGASFYIFLWSIINCYSNYMIYIYFPLALLRSNSSHCQLMD